MTTTYTPPCPTLPDLAADRRGALITALRDCVGASHVLVRGEALDGDLAAYEHDWRKRWQGQALAVVKPGDTSEVAAVVRLAGEFGVSLVPQGGNTGLVLGGVPDTSGHQLLLSLTRLNRVRAVDTANLTITVEAGCILQNVQQAADEAGLFFALSLAAEGSCTIGGNLSTNAGGTQVLRYGNARALCLGLEVVTPAGEIWNGLAGLRKDNTGYDLRDLYIGAEGTLGIITAASMVLHPKPAARLTAMASCTTLGDTVALLVLAQARCNAALTGFEVMGAYALELVRKHYTTLHQPLPPAPWTVLLELSDSEGEVHAQTMLEGLLEAALDTGLITDAAVASSIAQSRTMWHLRESIPLAQADEGLNIKHDIALPVSAIPEFVRVTDAALQARWPGAQSVNFGHLGDGNLHYNLQAPPGSDMAAFLREHEAAVNKLVYDSVASFGGSISAEHGVGQLKRDELVHYKSPVALALMRSIKRALDPRGLMNPGRVV
ncbi:MAG: FAD-binding oxidoreductase [Burkholderiales bacterium]|nr:FAD-binding oxidoreductase [Burkholderiales bacterium]